MSKLIEHFPYPEARDIQSRILDALDAGWDKHDVFCIVAPPALGKTALSKTLHNAYRSVSTITPTNMLVSQYLDEFPDTAALHRLDSYRCEEWQRPCSRTRNKLHNFCKGCPAGTALATAKFRRGPGIYNYQTYLAHKIYRDVLVIDEAHLVIPMLQDRFSTIIWRHDVNYPMSALSNEKLLGWLLSLPEKKRKGKKLSLLFNALTSKNPEYSVEITKEEFNGKGTIRGEPEMRDCIRLVPNDVRDQPPVLWPDKDVKKIILLSATISRKDVEALGLSRKRVLYINGESPIPAANRPVFPVPVTPVHRGNLQEATSLIAEYIEKQLIPRHIGEKGLVHATYKQAELLKIILTNSRFMFHERWNKREVYEEFRKSPASEGKVLVASGLYEGIDLPGELGRWQVLAKIPWLNLGAQVVKYNADKDSEWYTWNTLKTVIQAAGRICRTPTDYGITYVLDTSFDRLIREAKDAGLVPEWFLDAIINY